MSKRTAYEKAQTYNLSREQVVILYRVAYWFNGHPLETASQHTYIGNAYEPTLRELCGGAWEPEYEVAHQKLIDRGFFKTADGDDKEDKEIYVAGRRCRWLPTAKSFKVVEHIFSDETDLYPGWLLDEHSRPPTFRDGSELLEHRKGAMAARHLFKRCERCTGSDLYPRIDVAHRSDLRLFGAGDLLARVEVLTNHNDRASWKKKFIHWSDPAAGPTIWIFANRETMVNFWNHMLRTTTLELDRGEFGGESKNWSARRVNDRVRRMRQSADYDVSVDASWTIGGLIEADRVDAFEFLNRNNIILNS